MASNPLSDADRVKAYLDLCQKARQRFRELEAIEWKVNFSIWAFLGAIAYFLLTSTPPRKVGPVSMFLLLTIPLHGRAIVKLSESEQGWRQWATYYRTEARKILEFQAGNGNKSMPIERDAKSLVDNDKEWLVLEVGTTALIASAVIYLIW